MNNDTHVKPSNKLLLHMSSLGEDITLQLKQNPSLTTVLSSNIVKNPSCFYHGNSLSHPDSAAAVSICDGVVSDFSFKPTYYFIRQKKKHIFLSIIGSIVASDYCKKYMGYTSDCTRSRIHFVYDIKSTY